MIGKLLPVALLAFAPALHAADGNLQSGFRPGGIVLLMPEFEMRARTTTEGLQSMILASIRGMDAWAIDHQTDLSGCVVFLAARPQARVRTWANCGAMSTEALDRYVTDQIHPDEIAPVSSGTVVLSLVGADTGDPIAGARRLPLQWQPVLHDGDAMDMESIIDIAWPQ